MNAFTKPLIMTLRRQKDVLGGGNERGEQRWLLLLLLRLG